MNRRALVVDDDRNMCKLVEADLTSRGYDVEFSLTGDDAFNRLSGHEFDVVLTDLQMPGAGGIDLCKRIVDSRPDLPVVVMTAFGSMETAVAAIRAGVYDFIGKPVDAVPKVKAIGRLLIDDKSPALQQ